MSDDRLWAPWRMQYILAGDEAADECILCAYPTDPSRFRERRVLVASEHAFVMLNKYPYNNGHIMVVPRQHVSDFAALDDTSYRALADTLRGSIAALRASVQPHGLNVGMNLGRVAGAGIDQHLHWHVVPRWNGDTNFMPVVGGAKVMSDSLDASWERMAPHFASLGRGPTG